LKEKQYVRNNRMGSYVNGNWGRSRSDCCCINFHVEQRRMKYQREDYHPWANKRANKQPERRKPIYMLREIADMLGIEHQEILSKIKSAVKRGLPHPKVVLRVVGGDNKRFYEKTEVIKFLEEHK